MKGAATLLFISEAIPACWYIWADSICKREESKGKRVEQAATVAMDREVEGGGDDRWRPGAEGPRVAAGRTDARGRYARGLGALCSSLAMREAGKRLDAM